MKAYVELIQRKERDLGCDVLTHQKVSADMSTYPHSQSLSIPCASQTTYGADSLSGPAQTTPTP
jgi:isocitrate lyase